MVRASTYPGGWEPPSGLDITQSGNGAADAREWLSRLWSDPTAWEAIATASPATATQVERVIQAGGELVDAADVRRVVVTVAGYLRRWQRRATPFGLFAGVAVVHVGGSPAKVRWGEDHQAVARLDAGLLTDLLDRVESRAAVREQGRVVANNLATVRDGQLLVPARPTANSRTIGTARDVAVRLTRPLRAAVQAAGHPIEFRQLLAQLVTQFSRHDTDHSPGSRGEDQQDSARRDAIRSMLHQLIDQDILLTDLRPPLTSLDPLGHVLQVLRTSGAIEADPDLAGVLPLLDEARSLLIEHNTTAGCRAAGIRRTLTTSVVPQLPNQLPNQRPVQLPGASVDRQPDTDSGSSTGSGPSDAAPVDGAGLAIDVRLDAEVTLPAVVLDEVARAADRLLDLTTLPYGTTAWVDYHARFRARYGAGALVPVTDLVSDAGLGYPAGYLGAPRARPTWRMITDRDSSLLGLIQQATLERRDELVLSEADLPALRVGTPGDAPVLPERLELGVLLQARDLAAVDRGDFRLWVSATPAVHTSMLGRFSGLLPTNPFTAPEQPPTSSVMGSSETNGQSTTGSVAPLPVQLVFPPRLPRNQNVARTPWLMPALLPLGHYPPDPRDLLQDPLNGQGPRTEHDRQDGRSEPGPGRGVIELDDVAVTADAAQFYLLQRSTGRTLAPQIPHALAPTTQIPPLARFLAEIARSRTAVYRPFDLGAAGRLLPYVPRIRTGRLVLSAARWLLDLSALPTDRSRWWQQFESWREQWGVPDRVVLTRHGSMLPLDLTDQVDRAVLQRHLARETGTERIELREDLPADAHGWIGRPAELVIPLTARTPHRPEPPPTAAPGLVVPAGHGEVVQAQLVGNPARHDDLLLAAQPALNALHDGGVRRWWFTRYRDLMRPETDQYLTLLLRLDAPTAYAAVAARLAQLAEDLRERALPGDLTLAPYRPQPGRFGHGPATACVEEVFAADTRAALAQISATRPAGPGSTRGASPKPVSAQGLAAASMARIAASFAADPVDGCRALIEQVPRSHRPVDRAAAEQARRLCDHTGQAVSQLRGGEQIAATWHARDTALRAYRQVLAKQRDPATALRSLLHQHHRRALGVDTEVERATGHLARAAAMRLIAATGREP